MSAQQKVEGGFTTQSSWSEGSSEQREGSRFISATQLTCRDSRLSHGSLGSVITTNFYMLAYHHGGLGIFFFQKCNSSAIIWGDGQIFFVEGSTVQCHFSGNIQLLWYMNYLSCSLRRLIAFLGLCVGAAEKSLLLQLVSAPPDSQAELWKCNCHITCSSA